MKKFLLLASFITILMGCTETELMCTATKDDYSIEFSFIEQDLIDAVFKYTIEEDGLTINSKIKYGSFGHFYNIDHTFSTSKETHNFTASSFQIDGQNNIVKIFGFINKKEFTLTYDGELLTEISFQGAKFTDMDRLPSHIRLYYKGTSMLREKYGYVEEFYARYEEAQKEEKLFVNEFFARDYTSRGYNCTCN